ncbi:GTP cyclohydrolase II [Patellaria atrata CBS 101060]|uniref:GTP cyclohydrolase II n=1 Tax=Patellaria atrata CBS 101060 TaxID=1346257 RepID=A0A9P4S9G2_9PEZI|nr:GTP cyclohydrolase II [Patellaria atrata CBS 101060]
MTPDHLPSHASPAFPPFNSPRPALDSFNLDSKRTSSHNDLPPILSPAFTPPATPGTGTPALHRPARSHPINDASTPAQSPKLVDHLPEVHCEVRARIPTIHGHEMYIHLYTNSEDNKEHLAIVFGDKIRSRSLDAVRPGETERDRMIRGAYVGRLHPGRTSSRIEALKREEAEDGFGLVFSPPSSSSSPKSSTESIATSAEGETDQIPTTALDVPPLVRIHSECYTGETVWSARCDCGEQLNEAARQMSLPSPCTGGVIVYLRQEGRGIGLGEKLKAYNLQDLGNDTYEANVLLRHPADARSYGLATAILLDLGLGGERGIRLLTNNPDKVRAVEGPKREVCVKERVEMVPLAWRSGGKEGIKSEEVEKYLSTKIEKFKHMLDRA